MKLRAQIALLICLFSPLTKAALINFDGKDISLAVETTCSYPLDGDTLFVVHGFLDDQGIKVKGTWVLKFDENGQINIFFLGARLKFYYRTIIPFDFRNELNSKLGLNMALLKLPPENYNRFIRRLVQFINEEAVVELKTRNTNLIDTKLSFSGWSYEIHSRLVAEYEKRVIKDDAAGSRSQIRITEELLREMQGW